MRSFSPVLVVLIGAVLAQANVHHRRYVNDQDSENQIDTTGTPVEEPERHYHHHRRHYHGRHHHFDRVHRRSRANLSEAEETIEFHRFYMRNVRALAEESGLCNEDVNTLLNIIEESRPPFKKEDRSQWTEEQWQKSKEECDQRKQLVRAQAFAQIQDQIHLTIFFDKLEAQKKQMKENIHKYIVGRLTRIAVRSGLNDSQIEKFVRELESHKPVGVHWRPGMSQNEKRKNIEIHVRNWLQIKEACLRDATEAEQVQFNRFFEAVEKDFARSMSGDHPRMRHHQRRHRHYHRRPHVDEDFSREHVHRDSETENLEPEMHHHRHNRRRPHYDGADRDFEESPRRTHRRHHETEVEELAPLRRHRSDEIYDSEERDVRPHHHHRRHYHHRRPNYVDSEERVEYVPERHHRRHHRVREEVSDSSEEQRDEEFEPRRHHHRHHHNRHEDREQIDDSKVRSEPYRHYRRHVRRGDVEE